MSSTTDRLNDWASKVGNKTLEVKRKSTGNSGNTSTAQSTASINGGNSGNGGRNSHRGNVQKGIFTGIFDEGTIKQRVNPSRPNDQREALLWDMSKANEEEQVMLEKARLAKSQGFDFNPTIDALIDAKSEYESASTEEERQAAREKAKPLYDILEEYDFNSQYRYRPEELSSDSLSKYKESSKRIEPSDGKTKAQKFREAYSKPTGVYEELLGKAYENPFDSPEAKSIMAKYDYDALRAKDNAIASDASENGGYIDSYAAANALRQQTAMISQGQGAVLQAHQQKIDNARAILSDMGIEASRQAADEQTAQNNEVSRQAAKAEVSGVIPTSWQIESDSFYSTFLNSDGSMKSQWKGTDFTTLMKKALSDGNPALAEKYKVLRGAKIATWPKEFGKYLDGNVSYLGNLPTESARQANEANAAALNAALADANASMYKADQDAYADMYVADRNASADIYAADRSLEGTKYKVDTENGGGENWTEYNNLLEQFGETESGPVSFIAKYIKPNYESNEIYEPVELAALIIENSKDYGITVDAARKICNAYGYDTSWLDNVEYKSGRGLIEKRK